MLEVKELKKTFSKGLVHKKSLKAVDGISLTIGERETFGLVGESGCGKTTVGRLILRLIESNSGEVIFNGINITGLKKADLRKLRPKMQILFQDADSSLHPRLRIRESIAEPLKLYKLVPESEIEKKVLELLEMVGLQKEHMNRYPHELSGGQNQRVVLARVLALGPRFIVADEPTSALDVSVQAQILSLINEMQQKFGFSCLFISHDLGVIRKMTSKLGVMYLGKLVETGRTEDIFENPKHPYTKALIAAVRIVGSDKLQKICPIEGEMPDPMNPPSGCKFHTRCPQKMDICERIEPEMVNAGNVKVACHLF
ncbi:ABC transporter ATP-binding protein [Methanosarcina sp.]|uniref:ABC transporter ATP-binding protein n=1 Tax=Methanosarcina sp. TaxID=2213 RepID=UPI00298926A6|nr:ABC transporter ATP-binding protein [Methanosarcina sp.]MDW5549168.1 ABC transporter ATP-binding protein [Methanosarcina sp.]MDW5553126.1 ABC transporter ATP-binding protein [Methanosarcina sp.]MDW5559348.1 ABC transporter ATP-binding protein [Methanosarcina sp.]